MKQLFGISLMMAAATVGLLIAALFIAVSEPSSSVEAQPYPTCNPSSSPELYVNGDSVLDIQPFDSAYFPCRTAPLADDSPCSLGARYYVEHYSNWQQGVCSRGQQSAYDIEIDRLLKLFEENDIVPTTSPCSVNYIDFSKSSGNIGPRPDQFSGNGCDALFVNQLVFPVSRFGEQIDIPLINGLGAGFNPGPAPYYAAQGVDTNPKSRCFGLESDDCLELLCALDGDAACATGTHVDKTPAPALPPVIPNAPQPAPAEVNPSHFAPGGVCSGLTSTEECFEVLIAF